MVPGLEIGPRQEYPVRVMQFGEGNFLRAFIDWMIDKSNEAGKFNGMVQLVQPLPQGTADLINEQDGLYTLILRGMENGARPNTNGSSPASRGASRPRPSGTKSSNAPCLPTLELVFSNTTEAGIEYRPEPCTPGEAQSTFPAKVTSLLHERFKAGRKGLVFVPCELIDRNRPEAERVHPPLCGGLETRRRLHRLCRKRLRFPEHARRPDRRRLSARRSRSVRKSSATRTSCSTAAKFSTSS